MSTPIEHRWSRRELLTKAVSVNVQFMRRHFTA